MSFDPVHQVDQALVVDPGQVAGVQPAVDEGLGGRLRACSSSRRPRSGRGPAVRRCRPGLTASRRTSHTGAGKPTESAWATNSCGRNVDTLEVSVSLNPVPNRPRRTFVLAVIRDATQPERRSDLAELALDAAAVKGSIDLLDRVVRHLFQVGLSLQTAAGLPAGAVRERLAVALDELDAVIRDVRDYAFTSGGGADPAPLEPSRPVSLAATCVRKPRMVASATRRSTARSSTPPTAPNGGR